MAPGPAERLRSLSIELPPSPRAAGSYSPVVVDRGLAYVSGQIATREGTILWPGLVDRDVSVADAQAAARQAVLQGLSALASALGSLDRVRRVVRVGVYVASSPGFARQHEVGNGATELLIQIFDESGRPARASFGVTGLPLNASVEVELAAAVRVGDEPA